MFRLSLVTFPIAVFAIKEVWGSHLDVKYLARTKACTKKTFKMDFFLSIFIKIRATCVGFLFVCFPTVLHWYGQSLRRRVKSSQGLCHLDEWEQTLLSLKAHWFQGGDLSTGRTANSSGPKMRIMWRMKAVGSWAEELQGVVKLQPVYAQVSYHFRETRSEISLI